LQTAVNTVFPVMPAFFGRPKSRNNETYRKWGIKKRSNEEMREDYLRRARELVVEGLGLKLPEVKLEAA
jgi:ring-1,2-phenylacetyl-CoA epoxidase subunit PaaA